MSGNPEIKIVRKLPLWKSCWEEMEKDGIHYGKQYPVEFFESRLSSKHNSVRFGRAVYQIRRQLEYKGFHLQGHAQREGRLVIVTADKNFDVARSRSRLISKQFQRQIVLLQNTDLGQLTERQKRRHLKYLERQEIRYILFKRDQRIKGLVKEHAPKMIED